ncbi:conserved hypothetical protein [Microbacterium sp. 8M]|uniref:hypothetical protein n=1 Tax=Microbacterium sp. 8M TaxID=2653153 RepID=UPI0012EEE167|nr:hypothetical protein [Microbacterium sp. 8M]VXB25634.1 conserved hypothetical protein [Microbacterium sp. 8M]
MTSPAPRRALLESIVDEFLHDYPRGARLLAVASPDTGRSADWAGSLRTVLEERGIDATTVAQDDRAETDLRTEVVAPFRAQQADAVLIVSGATSLLAERTRGLWHYSVWLIEGDEVPHTAATALIDVTDPDAPARRLADYCAVPPSFLT